MCQASTACQRVQGYGLWAQIHRVIDKPAEAQKAIDEGFFIGADCDSCIADLYRRRAVLRRSRQEFESAIDDATESIELYLNLGHCGHDLHGNGLASAFHARAGIHLYAGDVQASIQDLYKALSLIEPKVSPTLHRLVVASLAVALYHSGSHSDVLEAEKYLKQARRLFIGVRKGSQERARLDWVTSQVRFRLRKEKPYRTMETMERSLADFLALGLTPEAVAVGADIMKMKTAKPWGRDSYRPVIWRILKTLSEGLPQIPTELCEALKHVDESAQAHHLGSHQVLKDAIDSLREACGPKMIPCLVSW